MGKRKIVQKPMKKPFDGTFKLTQAFDDICCRASYAKFGMKGHNGLDYGCPTGTKILAPHDGKVIESTLDPQGYGIYVKIENSIEGSVLAHLREARVGVGDGVKEGDLIGYSDNSGNSKGPHLHWGYYRFPRDRQNGFAGFIDQTPYIGQGASVDPQIQLDQLRKERDDNYNKFAAVCEALGVAPNVEAAVAEAKKLVGNDDLLVKRDKQIAEANTQIADLQAQLTDLSTKHESMRVENAQLKQDLKDQNEVFTQKLDKNTQTILLQANELLDLETALQTLKDGINKPTPRGLAKIWEGLLEALGKR